MRTSAWQGNRPSSISRTPQSRSSNSSPRPQNNPKANAPPPQSDTPKAVENNQGADAGPTKGQPDNSGGKSAPRNVWELRKNAAQQARPTPSNSSTSLGKEGPIGKEGGKRSEGATTTPAPTAPASAPAKQKSEEQHVPVNGFNQAEVEEFLKRGKDYHTLTASGDHELLIVRLGASHFQSYKVTDPSLKSGTPGGSKGKFTLLVKSLVISY